MSHLENITLIPSMRPFPGLPSAQQQLTYHLIGLDPNTRNLINQITFFIQQKWNRAPEFQLLSRIEWEKIITDEFIGRESFLPYPFLAMEIVTLWDYASIIPYIPNGIGMMTNLYPQYTHQIHDLLAATLKYPFKFLEVTTRTNEAIDIASIDDVLNDALNNTINAYSEARLIENTRVYWQEMFLTELRRTMLDDDDSAWTHVFPNLERIFVEYNNIIESYEQQIYSFLQNYRSLRSQPIDEVINQQRERSLVIFEMHGSFSNPGFGVNDGFRFESDDEELSPVNNNSNINNLDENIIDNNVDRQIFSNYLNAPSPIQEPIPEPIPEPIQEPIQEPIPEPIVEPLPQSIPLDNLGEPIVLQPLSINDIVSTPDLPLNTYSTALTYTSNQLFTYMYNPLHTYKIYMKQGINVQDITTTNILEFIHPDKRAVVLPTQVGISERGLVVGYASGVKRNIRFFAKNAIEDLLFKKLPAGVCSLTQEDRETHDSSIVYSYVFNFDLPLQTLNNLLPAMISFLLLQNEPLTLNYQINILPMLWELFFNPENKNKYARDLSTLFERVFSGIVNESGVQLTPERVSFKETHPEYFNPETFKEIDINSEEYKLYSYLVMLYCNEYKQQFHSQPKINTPSFNDFYNRYLQITSTEFIDPFAGDSDDKTPSLAELMAKSKQMWQQQPQIDDQNEGGVQQGGHGNPQLLKELSDAIEASPEFEGLRYTLDFINTAQLSWTDIAKLYNLLTFNNIIDSNDNTYMGIFGLIKEISKPISIDIEQFKTNMDATIPGPNERNLTMRVINPETNIINTQLTPNKSFTQFMELLNSLSQLELQQLLWFWSGTPNVIPNKIYGVKFTFEPQTGLPYFIPKAGTCFFRLDIGTNYDNTAQMKQALFAAINSESMTAAAYEGGKKHKKEKTKKKKTKQVRTKLRKRKTIKK